MHSTKKYFKCKNLTFFPKPILELVNVVCIYATFFGIRASRILWLIYSSSFVQLLCSRNMHKHNDYSVLHFRVIKESVVSYYLGIQKVWILAPRKTRFEEH